MAGGDVLQINRGRRRPRHGDPDGAGDGTARITVLYYVMDLIGEL